MNAATQLAPIERAKSALKTADREDGLRKLIEESVDLVAVRDQVSRDQVHGAYMRLKNTRLDIEKAGEVAREDARLFGKAVIVEEKRLLSITSTEEARLKTMRDDWDQAEERERLAKVEAERQRLVAIEAAAKAAEIQRQADEAARLKAERDAFEKQQADARKADDERRAKIEAEERAARARIQKQEDEARARVKAEEDRLAAERRAVEDQQRKAREEREASERAERDRVEADARAKQQAIDAEARRVRDEQEALERHQREERIRIEEAEHAADMQRRNAAEALTDALMDIVQCIAKGEKLDDQHPAYIGGVNALDLAGVPFYQKRIQA